MRRRSTRLALLGAVMIASGCSIGRIDTIENVVHPIPHTLPPDRKAELSEQNRIVRLTNPADLRVTGVGTCERLRVHFGDGQTQDVSNHDFTQPFLLSHTYSGWGGPKTVRAEAVLNCVGDKRAELTVEPATFALAVLAPVNTACTPIHTRPPLRPGTVVSAAPLNMPEDRINFGCPFGGCVYGIDGATGSAGAGFPFPGLRPYSLVYRIGSQVAQGGNGVAVTVTGSGPLEICLNDDVLPDNTGGWGVTLAVDERAAQ